MGIGDGELKETIDSCLQNTSFSEFKRYIRTELDSPRIAVDFCLIMYKFYIPIWSSVVSKLKSDGLYTEIRENVMAGMNGSLEGLSRKFLDNGFQVVFCIDGEKVKDKFATESRREIRERRFPELLLRYAKYKKVIERDNPTSSMFKSFDFVSKNCELPEVAISVNDTIDNLFGEFISFLKTYHFFPENIINKSIESLSEQRIKVIRIPEISEGEKLACILTHIGYCQAVYTTDSDALLYNPRCIIKNIEGDRIFSYNPVNVLKKLELDNRQFFYLAVLLGNDFNVKVRGDGLKTALERVKDKYFDINQYNVENCGCLRIARCAEIFSISDEEIKLVASAIRAMF